MIQHVAIVINENPSCVLTANLCLENSCPAVNAGARDDVAETRHVEERKLGLGINSRDAVLIPCRSDEGIRSAEGRHRGDLIFANGSVTEDEILVDRIL